MCWDLCSTYTRRGKGHGVVTIYTDEDYDHSDDDWDDEDIRLDSDGY
jgi:hypothetical protein